MLEVEDGAVPVTPVVMGVVDEAAVAEAVVAAEAVAAEAVAVEAVVETTTTMTTRVAPHPLPSQVHPDVDVGDDEPTGSSTTPKCNNN